MLNDFLIDSHCHPNSDELRGDADVLMERAKDAGVGRMLIVGCDLENSREAVDMAHRFAGYGAFASIGIHPHEAAKYLNFNFQTFQTEAGGPLPAELLKLAEDDRVVALGETGLDYHYDFSPRDAQRKIFEAQLEWAAGINRPVVLHIREAMPDALAILKNFSGRVRLLFHCYSGGLEYLDEVLSMGALCAIGGAVTWKGRNGDGLREVARRIPLERLLLETDCPWLTPVPFRGRLNEPAYVRYVYEAVARLKDMSVSELAGCMIKNASEFFKFFNRDTDGTGAPNHV